MQENTIAGRLVTDLERKLDPAMLPRHGADLALYKKVLGQKRGGTNKRYSLHEPSVKCYAKEKEHKKFEFGSKVSIAVRQRSGIILGAFNFTETLLDSKTTEQT